MPVNTEVVDCLALFKKIETTTPKKKRTSSVEPLAVSTKAIAVAYATSNHLQRVEPNNWHHSRSCITA